MPHRHRWDIFCKVIDNFGDIGVSWRLASQLAKVGQHVRLWTDDASALSWMAPDGESLVDVLPWSDASNPLVLAQLQPADVWIESFGCDLPSVFVAHAVSHRARQPLWLNLEYLSAEDWVQRMHGLPSPVLVGPAQGWTKRFVYPGFTAQTAGLLREPNLQQLQTTFDPSRWLQSLAQNSPLNLRPKSLKVSLFCYEPQALPELLLNLTHQTLAVDLLVAPGRPWEAMQAACRTLGWQQPPDRIKCHALPWFSQQDFDHLLWSCDFNAVRGEDSLVRALWAGKPLLWQLYPQHDQAHHIKLNAFLNEMQWPDDLAMFNRWWNDLPVTAGRSQSPCTDASVLADWPARLNQWQASVHDSRARLLAQTDLVQHLLKLAKSVVSKDPPMGMHFPIRR